MGGQMASDYRGVDATDVKRSLLSLLSAVLVILLALFVGSIVAALAASALVSVGIPFESTTNYVVRVISQFVGFGLAVAGYLSLSDAWSVLRARAPSLRDAGWAIAGIVALLVLSQVIGLVLARFGISPAQNQVIAMGRQNPVVFLYMIPITLLFVAPFEERVFRGAAQGFLRRTFGSTVAVAIASALFGTVHLVALIGGGIGQLAYVAIAALLGVVLGGIYEHTRNLFVPIAIHGVYNAVLFAIQWLKVTGGAPS